MRGVFAEASSALGQDLWQLVEEGPAEELNSTVNTQPVMLTAGYAVYRAWREAGGAEPDFVAGHSLGEYTALVAAGALAFRDAVPLVRFRAQAMQEAVPIGEGAMAAILGLDDDALRAACSEAAQGEVVEAVNFNAPSQVVIAGTQGGGGARHGRGEGARRQARRHAAGERAVSFVAAQAGGGRGSRSISPGIDVAAPRIPVVNNVDVAVETDPQRIRDALARQACEPVRWVEVVRRLAAAGVGHVAECGPGKVLAGLTRRIDGRLAELLRSPIPSRSNKP